MLISFAKDLKVNLDTINEIGKNKENKAELKSAVFEFIEFHSDVQQLSTIFNQICDYIF